MTEGRREQREQHSERAVRRHELRGNFAGNNGDLTAGNVHKADALWDGNGRTRIQANFDVYNAFNANSVVAISTTYGAAFLQRQQILDARLFKFSAQVEF